MNCRISDKPLYKFMDFGDMPLGNGFLNEKDFNSEHFYKMSIGFCPESKMVQLLEQPDASRMFHDHYAFFTGSSNKMSHHFQKHASSIHNNYLCTNDASIIEIGCNDGTFLEYFSKNNIKHLGVDPSENVVEHARSKGVICHCDFFSTKSSCVIEEIHGKADVITAANVICHIPDFLDVLSAANKLLKRDGVFIFEEPYLGDVVQKVSYDQFYDEHVYMFSALSVNYAANQCGLELINVEHLETHGGSMRYNLAKKSARPIEQSVSNCIHNELNIGLDKIETFQKFNNNCEISKQKLMEILDSLKSKSIPVVGYAATSKSTTVTQYCGITSDHMNYICDTTPIKQGKFSPGAHIPIKSYQFYKENLPDYALLFAWNHRDEIMVKEKEFTQQNGKWIQYVPSVSIA